MTRSEKITEFQLIVGGAMREHHPDIKFEFLENVDRGEVSLLVEYGNSLHDLCTITYEGLDHCLTEEFKDKIRYSIKNTEFVKND